VSSTKWIDCCGVKVSVDAVVWSIPCYFPKSYDGFVPVVRWLYDQLLSHLCFSSFLFNRRPKRSASQPPTAPELEAASGYVLLLSSFVVALRLLSIRHSTAFSPLFLVISLRQTSASQRPKAPELEDASEYVLLLSSFVFVLRVLPLTISLTVVSTFSRLVDRLVTINAFSEAATAVINANGLQR
jgi:hypothetical protein